MDDIQVEENTKWISAREAFVPQIKPSQPAKVDEEVSKIVGHKIYVNDPRLIKIICDWKRAQNPDKPAPDNFLHDEAKRKELIKKLR